MKKRDVTMVEIPVRNLKRAFVKAFPEKTAKDLYPQWLRFWSSVVLTAKVTQVPALLATPQEHEGEEKDI